MRRASFFVDDRHAWLDQSHPHWGKTNIGADGSNLTICLLSLNRINLTIRLIRSVEASIPYFAGRILVVDNGSDAEELSQLEAFLVQDCPFPHDVLKLGRNHGVAGGRNRGFEVVATDWVLSLDNDIYLIGNPLPALRRDLATLGCHFLSVPLLNPDGTTFYSFGGHLHPTLTDDKAAFLGTACMLPPNAAVERASEISPTGEGFLCSFLFGGASLLNRRTFLAAGGFDENMLVGFEDTEFSLRLFRLGYKVGSSSVASFVHDHAPASLPGDKDYERTRYSRRILKQSAEYFEKKHGFRVWNTGTDAWLMERERLQDIAAADGEPASEEPSARRSGRPLPAPRPRIALVVDMENWSYANIARQLEKNLGSRFDFEIISTMELSKLDGARWSESGQAAPFVPGGPQSFGQILIQAPDFDIVHVFWRPILTLLGEESFYGDELERYAGFLGLAMEDFKRRFVEPACFTTSVYDHLFADGSDGRLMAPVFNRHTAAYTVSSPRLADIYGCHPAFRPPSAVIPDGVDRELFHPKNLERFETTADREVVVGWVGNSRWLDEKDSKGVNSILIPAVTGLQAEGLRLRLDFADRVLGFIPHERMVDYYARIDVLVCTSESEGTPNPVLEALACGVPIVSTDVGIVRDALGPAQRAFILEDRSVAALQRALRALLADPGAFARLSTESLGRAEAWDWSVQAEKFGRFFDGVLEARGWSDPEARTKICMLPFTTPSQEPDGNIRLCSASSAIAYRDETNMGNCRESDLETVWRGEKYRRVRSGLLKGASSLAPYCASCEYRHDGPAWLLQLHVALHAFHNGVADAQVADLIRARLPRYEEYLRLAKEIGLAAYPRPPDLVAVRKAPRPVGPPESVVDGKDLPIYLDLNTLNRCNVSCIMCPPAIKHDRGEDKSAYYRLTLEEFERLIRGTNVKSAHFVGAYAEPLLNKDIFRLVQAAHDHGAFTAITTNAMPLVPQFSRKLIEARLDMMSISLHGATKQTAEKIMLRSNFERVLGNIRVLQELKREYKAEKPDLYLNFVSQLANVAEAGDFIDLAHDLEVRHVQIIHLIDGDEAVDGNSNLTRYPDLLVPNLRDALQRGKERGVNVIVSPAYAEALATYDFGDV